MPRLHLAFVCLAALLPACATVDPAPDFARTRELISASTGSEEVYAPDDPPTTTPHIDAALADGLGVDEAVGIALTHNRRLQAEFTRIGVRRAEWVQSGLLTNPTLDAAIMFPVGGGRSNLAATLAQNVMELWRIPVRKRIAQEQLNDAVLSIARLAGELAADVRRAYADALAARQMHTVANESLQIVRRSHNAVQQQLSAGAATAFDENLARGQTLSAELAVRTARLDAANALRRLAVLLSIDANVDNLKLTDKLPQPRPLEADALVSLAHASRLDLQAADAAALAADAAVDLERSRSIPDVNLGPTLERLERQGGTGDAVNTMAGPALSLEIPIFDQNQAQIARAMYLREELDKVRQQLRIAITQDVRIAADRVNTAAANLAFFRDQLLPQAQRSFDLATESFRGGRANLLMLLESQRALLESRRGYIAVQQEAAAALADLERTVGTHALPAPTAKP